MSEKISQNERHLCLVAHILTKLSQNVCLINIHTLVYQYTKCNCMLWKAFQFYYIFWVFSYIIDKHSCLKCKYLHQTFTDCISDSNKHFGMSICQMWLQVMECFQIQLHFLGYFSYITIYV